jgi:SRSO17 transposase
VKLNESVINLHDRDYTFLKKDIRLEKVIGLHPKGKLTMAEEHEVIRRQKIQDFFSIDSKTEDKDVEKRVDDFLKAHQNEHFVYDLDLARNIFENKNYFSYSESNQIESEI